MNDKSLVRLGMRALAGLFAVIVLIGATVILAISAAWLVYEFAKLLF